MTITDRDITKQELQDIYEDFKKIDLQDGIPDAPQKRYQFVAEVNGTVIGFVSGLTNYKKWFYLSDMWVHEDFRRQGLGTRLLKMLEDKIMAVGVEHIYTWTTGSINQSFYEKQDYLVFTVFEDFYDVKGYHRFGYRKDLT